MKKKSIDSLFADKLQQAEITPREEAWAKLQNKMAKKEKKIVWLPFVRWSAAASVALLVGLGIWFMNGSQQPKAPTLAQTKTQTPNTVLMPKIEIQVAGNQEIKDNKSITKNRKIIVKDINELIDTTLIKVAEVKKVINEQLVIKQLETLQPETIATIQPEQTVRFELSEPTETLTETIASNTTGNVTSNLSKQKRISKIFRQLKNLKNGDDVDWQEVGVKSPRLLARLNGE